MLATPGRWRLARRRKARRARPDFDLEDAASIGLADVDRMLLQPMTLSASGDPALEPFAYDDLPDFAKRRAIERLAAEQAAAASDRRFRAALRTSPVTVFHLDCENRYTWVYNPGAGFSPDDMIGRTNAELIGAEHAAELEARLRKAVAAGVGSRDEITLTLGGEQRTYDFTVQPRYGTTGEVIGLAGVAVDITGRHRAEAALHESEARLRAMIDANPIEGERQRAQAVLEAAVAEKTSLAEQREGLLRDVNHRIKNSLQLIASMLRIQIGNSGDAVLQQGLAAAERRVLTVAQLHDQLYRRRDFANSIEIAKYLHDLGASLERTLVGNDTRIALRIAAQPVEVPTDKAVNIALILNELVTNAAKHAFSGRTNGVIAVNFEVLADGSFRLEVADDGNGLPVGFQPKTSGGLGMRILNALVGSLDASLQIESSDAGARFIVVIPA